jgi:hypothetical protein
MKCGGVAWRVARFSLGADTLIYRMAGISWSGQKGVRYTVEGNKASACAVGIIWRVRLTKCGVFRWTAGAR